MDELMTITSKCGLECLFLDDQYLQAGFYAGFAIGLLVVLFGFLCILLIRQRRRVSGVLLQSESGDLFITATAVHEFVHKMMEEFPDVHVAGSWIRRRGPGYELKLSAMYPFHAEVPKLTAEIKQHLQQCVQTKLGVDRPVRININVRGFAGEAPSGEAARKGGGVADGQRNPLTGFPGILGADEHDF